MPGNSEAYQNPKLTAEEAKELERRLRDQQSIQELMLQEHLATSNPGEYHSGSGVSQVFKGRKIA